MGAWSIGWPARSALCDFWRQPVAVVVYTEDDGRDLIESSRYERQPDMSVTASKRPSATDWERLATMQDADIDRSQIEELDKGFFRERYLAASLRKEGSFPANRFRCTGMVQKPRPWLSDENECCLAHVHASQDWPGATVAEEAYRFHERDNAKARLTCRQKTSFIAPEACDSRLHSVGVVWPATRNLRPCQAKQRANGP
jgi:hypothetical protein